jgi:hypothetical protein
VDPKRVVAVLGDLVAKEPTLGDELDVGASTGFEVDIGAGECAS